MKAQELRIGNCFMAGKNPAVVLEIMASGVSFDSINGDICASHCDWDYVSFIPLTEQWLIYFGFERDENPNKQPNWIWSKNGEIWLYQDWKTKSFVFNSHLKSNSTIKYVHQLQNLYFALTGKELQL